MGLELKQTLKTTQKLLLSVEVRNSIKILSLNRAELEVFVQEIVEKNPCLVLLKPKNDSYSRNYEVSHQPSSFFETESLPETMQNSLERQLSLMRLDEGEFLRAMLLVQHLDHNGFLSEKLEQIAHQHKVKINDLERALKHIHLCEPVGLGARDVQECLLLQLQEKSDPPKLVEKILREHWELLKTRQILKIARLEKRKIEDIQAACQYIVKNLQPQPASLFETEPVQSVTPDVYVFKRPEDGEWVCSLNEEGLPRVKISKRYEKLFADLKKGGSDAKRGDMDDACKYLGENLRLAKALFRAISGRKKTILKVTEVIIRYQTDFFERGVGHLVPLNLKVVADELDFHESTISRATSGKYLSCAQGLFELKYFFNGALQSQKGLDLANECLNRWIVEYIKAENKEKPLSDEKIAKKILTEKHVEISRRTVAKYREAARIPSSAKRARRF